MFNYIAFLHAGIEKPGNRALEDGNALANKCLEKLQEIDNPEQFPPRLLFLLISAKYLGGEDQLDEIRARQLIAGVRQSFFEAGHRNIPLIGSSVAAVFFEREIYYEGALLVCLASRMLDVSVSVATNVSSDPETAVHTLIAGLDIAHSLTEYPRALPNRVLLTFFPGTGTSGVSARSSTDKIHTLLLEKLTYQIPIVGGVSSANDPTRKKRGLQFVNQQTLTDGLAACLIRSGLPLATSMATGLQPVDSKGFPPVDGNNILNVERFSKDNQYIEKFQQGLPEDLFRELKKPILLRDHVPDGSIVRAKVVPDDESKKVRILRPVSISSALEMTIPDPNKMFEETLAAHELSLKRAKLGNPAGCLSFKCYGHLTYKDELGLNLPWGIKKMQERFGIPHYVGGFYDGEIATDATGAFTCGGWSVAALIVGDEISERTAVQGGLSTLERHGLALTATFELDEALKQSLDLVWDLGFPGAMISLMMTDHNPDQPEQSKGILVPVKAIGTRFRRVVKVMKSDGIDNQMPLGDKPVFITHDRADDTDVFAKAGIITEYVLPLHDSTGHVFALLRVDVGDQDQDQVHAAVRGVLNSISAIVGAAINRITNWQENRIARELDRSLTKSMSANTTKEGLHQFIRGTLNAFGLSNGHIRLVNSAHDGLVLEAGEGGYYKAALATRREVSFEDWSPSCEAFIRAEATIINDATNNIAHKRMSDSYAKDGSMKATLREFESYANVPFKNENGERLGTISLLSTEKWFFNTHHERALAALSRRVSFLMEHLKTKEETREAIQDSARIREQQEQSARNLELIRSITQRLDLIFDAETLRQKDICNKLEFATQTLCELVGANAAAFYLWDDDQQLYILRGQFGWKDDDWLHIARYRRTDNWIGAKGLADKPRYVPDLFQYYKEQQYSEPGGRYAAQIFGDQLSPDYTVEAIAAPLKLAGTQIGVLTLYGVPRPQGLQRTQFHTTAIWLLEEAINRYAGLIGVLLDRQSALEEERASSRRAQLIAIFASQRHTDAFEETVGRALTELFRADRIDFYRPSREAKSNKFVLLFQAAAAVSASDKLPEDVSKSGDIFIKTAVGRASVVPRRVILPRTEKPEPDVAVTDGMIDRAILPVVTQGEVSLVLDFHWNPKMLADLEPFNYFTVSELEELCRLLGSLYEKHLAIVESSAEERRRGQSRAVAHTFGMMMAQCGHKIETLLGLMEVKVNILSKPDPADLSGSIRGLLEFIGTQSDWVNRCKEAAKKAGEEKRNISLHSIIEAAINESGINETSGKVRHTNTVPRNLMVFANDDAVREVFFNLINNAAEAIYDAGTLNISQYDRTADTRSVKPMDDVVLVFEDNGAGMDDYALKQIGKNHTTKPGHHGLGTVICEALITSQNGDIKWESTPGHGTTVRVTLPSTQREE